VQVDQPAGPPPPPGFEAYKKNAAAGGVMGMIQQASVFFLLMQIYLHGEGGRGPWQATQVEMRLAWMRGGEFADPVRAFEVCD
jgi:hypothetical protein